MEGVLYCTEVRFASLLSGGFSTMAVTNSPEKKLAKRTSVCTPYCDWLSCLPARGNQMFETLAVSMFNISASLPNLNHT